MVFGYLEISFQQLRKSDDHILHTQTTTRRFSSVCRDCIWGIQNRLRIATHIGFKPKKGSYSPYERIISQRSVNIAI